MLAVVVAAVVSIEMGSRARFSDVEFSTANTVIAATEPVWLSGCQGDGEWHSPHWVVSMYANERKETTVTFGNSADEDVPVTLTAIPESQDNGNLIFGFDQPELVIPAKGKASVVFWVETTQGVAPGTYSTTVTVDSEWWGSEDMEIQD